MSETEAADFPTTTHIVDTVKELPGPPAKRGRKRKIIEAEPDLEEIKVEPVEEEAFESGGGELLQKAIDIFGIVGMVSNTIAVGLLLVNALLF